MKDVKNCFWFGAKGNKREMCVREDGEHAS